VWNILLKRGMELRVAAGFQAWITKGKRAFLAARFCQHGVDVQLVRSRQDLGQPRDNAGLILHHKILNTRGVSKLRN